MTIETKRLLIRTASEDEMRSLLARQTDKELIKAYGEMLQGCLDHPEDWNWYATWMIELKNGINIGDLCFKGLDDRGFVEIGYGITEENQGQGYATEAVEAAVDWALKQPGVCRVEAETDPDNKRSQRVLEKCGFIPSGIIGEEGPRFYKKNCKMVEYTLLENKLKAEDFIRLKVATGFRERPLELVKQALNNNLYDVVALVNDEVVGMGRLVGDGVMYWYLQEIVVLPEYQGHGIGTAIVNKLLNYIKEHTLEGNFTSVGLTAAEGKEGFYERFGFAKSRGMTKYIEN